MIFLILNIFKNMKKQVLPKSQKKIYLDTANKSKSPFNSFKKTPPKNVFTKTPPKQLPLMGVTFSAKQQKQAKNLYEPRAKSRKVIRNWTVEMIQICGSEVDNAEERSLTPRNLKLGEYQYFSLSLNKISQLRTRYNANNINEELNEVLNMIKEQKLKIGERMKILKKNNDYYRKLCQGYKANTAETGINTTQILDSQTSKIRQDKSTQIEQEYSDNNEEQRVVYIDKKQQERKERESQTYVKLYAMLEDMGINYQSILPTSPMPIIQAEDKHYKQLSQTEAIKIQKFFIQKLSSKLPK